MMALTAIVLGVIFLMGATSLRVLKVARGAQQGTLKELQYMSAPLIMDSINVAEYMPELTIIVDCAAKLIQEGDRTILSLLLLIARFIEAFLSTISFNWVVALVLFHTFASLVFIFFARAQQPGGPGANLVDQVLWALQTTRLAGEITEIRERIIKLD